MNRPGEWKTIARTDDRARAELWRSVFGINVAPIKSIIPKLVNLPGRPNTLCYMLDLEALADEQKKKLYEALSKKYNVLITVVILLVESDGGLPIPAEGVTVESTDPADLFALLQNSPDPDPEDLESSIGYEHEEEEWEDPDPLDIWYCPDCGLPRDICSCLDPKPLNDEDVAHD